jgi:putative sigma-54 modulation protein
MTIEITGRKIEVTPALRSFTEKKLKKLDRLLDGITEAHVILTVEKHRHTAEILVKSRLARLSGSETTNDLYASIGNVLEKIERQAKKLKDKHSWGKKRVKGVATIRAPRPEPEPEPEGEQGRRVQASPRLIRSRRYAVKPMTVDEAVLQVQDSKDSFLVFRDAVSQRVGVIYRRADGNFGLIEPEI